jgi:hypothetical protein
MSNHGGKGSKPRPFSVTQEEYDNRWDTIFHKDIPKEVKKVEEELQVDCDSEEKLQD